MNEGAFVADEKADQVQAAAEEAVELAAEVESSAEVKVEASDLEFARAVLHEWVDAMRGVVVNPGQGRVIIIHENGRTSTIASPDLPFTMSRPVARG